MAGVLSHRGAGATRRSLWQGLAAGLAVLAFTAMGVSAPRPASAQDVTVFAAASLKNALDEIVDAYKAETGKTVVVSYAASSALAKQIEEGAPADIFISADLDWMDYLDERSLVNKDTRETLLGNRIVLVAASDSTVAIDVAKGMDLAAALGADGKLAMANVDSVPAGKYGKAALTSLGVWDTVADRVAQADNVRAALAFVAQGEAPLGIVYATDAAAEPKVKIVGTFPEDSHPPILYPAAVLSQSGNADAAAFLAYLRSPGARAAFAKQGFTVIAPSS